MHKAARLTFALLANFLLVAPYSFAFLSPLSDTSVRSAYLLAQRYKGGAGEFLAPYTQFLPHAKAGAQIELVQFLTPFAQLVREYAARVGDYSAQQAELDHRGKEESVIVIIKINLTDSYSRFLSSAELSAAGLNKDENLRPSTFWKDFQFHALDDDVERRPKDISGRGDFLCPRWGSGGNCVLTGATVTMEIPASAFSSQQAGIEIVSPDGQSVRANFNLASLR